MEHKDLWDTVGEVPDDDTVVPFGSARTVREGDDLSIVTWSAMVGVCAEAAGLLAADGVSAEVIDLRTLWPWDQDAVLASVARTGRLIVVHEAVSVAGFGAEIAAIVGEALFETLEAPVRRLAAPRIPVSYAPTLEAVARITAPRVAAAAQELIRARRRGRSRS